MRFRFVVGFLLSFTVVANSLAGPLDYWKKIFGSNTQNNPVNPTAPAVPPVSSVSGDTQTFHVGLPVAGQAAFSDLPTAKESVDKLVFGSAYNGDMAVARGINDVLQVFSNDRFVWCATQAGLKIFDKSNKSWAFTPKLTSKETRPQEAIVDDADNAVWFYGNGLYRYDTSARALDKFIPGDADLSEAVIKKVLPLTNELMMLATDRGLIAFNKKTSSFAVTRDPALLAPIVRGVTVDHEAWLVTDDSKLINIQFGNDLSAAYKRYDLAPYKTPKDIYFFDGKVWLVLPDAKKRHIDVLASFDPGHGTIDEIDLGQSGILKFVQSQSGILFAGTSEGMFEIDPSGAKPPALIKKGDVARGAFGKNIVWVGNSYDFSITTGFVVRYVLDPSKYWPQVAPQNVAFQSLPNDTEGTLSATGDDFWVVSRYPSHLIRYDMRTRTAKEYYAEPRIGAGNVDLFADLFRGAEFPSDAPPRWSPFDQYLGDSDAYTVYLLDPIRNSFVSFSEMSALSYTHSAEDMTERWFGVGARYFVDTSGGLLAKIDPQDPKSKIASGLWVFQEKTGWTKIEPQKKGLASDYVTALAVNNRALFVGTDRGLFQMDRKSMSWKQRTNTYVLNVTASDDMIFVLESPDSISGYAIGGGGKKITIDLSKVRSKINFVSLVSGGNGSVANSNALLIDEWAYSLRSKEWQPIGLQPTAHAVNPKDGTIVLTDGTKLYKLVNRGEKFEAEETTLPLVFKSARIDGSVVTNANGEEGTVFKLIDDSAQ